MGPWDERRRAVKIIRRPEGEAPEWVRDAWIGLVLPLAVDDVVTSAAFGVLSMPRNRLAEWWRLRTRKFDTVTGYVVDAGLAIDLLAETQPEAADWWRTHCPFFCKPGQTFIFDLPACEGRR